MIIHHWQFDVLNFQHHLISFLKVNYVGKAGNLYQSGYQLNGSAYVISKHIGNTWLWDRVRVSGGAYGGFCDFDTHSGTLTILTCHYKFSIIQISV
jgi:Zn-dependent M16 (insulinase) family peptidase